MSTTFSDNGMELNTSKKLEIQNPHDTPRRAILKRSKDDKGNQKSTITDENSKPQPRSD